MSTPKEQKALLNSSLSVIISTVSMVISEVVIFRYGYWIIGLVIAPIVLFALFASFIYVLIIIGIKMGVR